MATRNRLAFTLVEMLVVITIIGVIMGLLVPAIGAVRAAARATQCANNEHEVASAIQQYETTKGQYPGYVETLVDHPVSWATLLLQSIRPDLWSNWRTAWQSGTPPQISGATNRYPGAGMDLFKCPSSPSPEIWALSYVVNCGQPDSPMKSGSTPPDWLANGVFHSHDTQGLSPDQLVYLSSTQIKDGTQCTLMLSENVQAGEWTDPYRPDSEGSSFNPKSLFSPPVEASVGMVWFATASPPKNCYINGHVKQAGYDAVIHQSNNSGDSAPKGGSAYTYARPSSMHAGFVNAAFCDGHVMRLKDTMTYGVFAQLMSTSSQEVMTPGSTQSLAGSLPYNDFRRPISEQDYAQ